MYKLLLKNFFLNSESFVVKMAALKTIAFVLSNDVEHQADLSKARADRSSQKALINEIFEMKTIEYDNSAMETQTENVDEYINEVADYVQLFSALFCANFVLRKSIIFELSKTVLQFKLSEETSVDIFQKILNFLRCDAGSLMDHNNLDDLLSRWFVADFPLDR